MSKQKSEYVVVDWGTWGIDVQLSTKIVVKDHLGVIKEGDACSLQGIDPVTKRPVMFEGEVLGVFGTKRDAEKMVTSLVSPAVKDAEQESDINAPRPRREPIQQCEELKRKKARKEHGEEDQNLKKPSSKQKQTDQEPEVSRKKKSVSKKRKVADPKDTQDRGFISAANTQRVQNLLERRQHVSCKPEVPVVEIEEGEEENRSNQPASSLQPKSKPQPSSIHLHEVQSAVPAEPVQINSESQPRPPQQSSNLSIATRSPSSSNYKSASPVNPASRFQFSSTPLGSSHSALRGRPLPSHLSMSSPQQFMNSSEVLSSPVIPQQEFSISQSLSHCSDYDVSDLESPITYSPRNSNLHQLQTVQGHISRDDSWHRTSFSADVNTSCPSCQPLLQSLSNRLSSLEAEVEKLRRKQRKGKAVSENEVVDRDDTNEERFNGCTKDALVRSVEDASDAKSAVETLAKQLFTTDELKNSSVTGFQCNKDYESRPGPSPSRRNLLENIVLKKAFPAMTRSSVRKDLNLLLKKARALNKENCLKVKNKNGK